MANRTIQFLGSGYAPTGTDPITVSATLAGNVIYTGTIPTSYTSVIDHLPTGQVVLFTCELPANFASTVPMSISLDNPVGVTVFFEEVLSNYMAIANPVYTPAQFNTLKAPVGADPAADIAERMAIWTACAVPPLSEADIAVLDNGNATWTPEKQAVLVAHNLTLMVSSGATTFVGVNGGPEPRTNVVINGESVTRSAEPTGPWGWKVEFPAEGSGLFECDLTVIAGQE
jgi:hypothetical protein